jgi:hypothetical protein
MIHPLPTIQMFWHGAPLSRLERLSIASFRENGHPVDLYVYDDPGELPPGVRLREAAEILPRSAIFVHRRSGSLGLFADWFRYLLLFERGGIWADADVVCLKPFEYTQPEIFGWQDERYINNAVLGLPPKHPLAKWLAEASEHPNRILPYDQPYQRLRKWRRRLLQGNRREETGWGESGPKGLTQAAHHMGYADRALPSWHFYPVAPGDHENLFRRPPAGQDALKLNGGSRAVHLWNNLLQKDASFDKNARFDADSPFEQLCRRYLEPERAAVGEVRIGG